jgi:hypothetical protein
MLREREREEGIKESEFSLLWVAQMAGAKLIRDSRRRRALSQVSAHQNAYAMRRASSDLEWRANMLFAYHVFKRRVLSARRGEGGALYQENDACAKTLAAAFFL